MKKVFTHENRMIVYNLRNLMQAEGIKCMIRNEFAGGGVGDLPAFDTWPELWVDDNSLTRAETLLRDMDERRSRGDWFCRGCGEANDAAFELCWQCGRAPDGGES